MKETIKVLTALTLAGGLFVTSQTLGNAQGDFDGERVSIGVASEAEEKVWKFVGEQAKNQEGIELEIVLFSDYVQPNIALYDGSTDLNAFQHVAFLNDWNQANNGDLVPLGFTYVTPLGLYSNKVASVDELSQGATIAIPNDPTNGGRALLALELAGLIEVSDEVGILPEVSDIIDNPLNIQIEELDAAQLAQVLADVDVAVINNTFALDAGLSLEDAIFLDAENLADLKDEYKNVIAVKKENADNPLLLKLVELYQTDQVADIIRETSKGGDFPAWSNLNEGEESSVDSASE